MNDIIDTETIVRETRRGFEPGERLRNRGLRKDTIVLFLNEELGPELGDARDAYNAGGAFIGRIREGILGEIDSLGAERATTIDAMRAKTIQTAGLAFAKEHRDDIDPPEFDVEAVEHPEYETPEIDAKLNELRARRDEIIAELTRTGLTISMRAIPPIIQKDCKRLAKNQIGWGGKKGIPEAGTDEREEYDEAHTAYLMTKLFQSVKDNETGEVNTETTYEDAIAYIGMLPPGQFTRLDLAMGKLQITDAISRTIEAQEDFS